MPKIRYIDKKLHASKLKMIATANAIIAEYAAQGFALTLRQLYYQFVARDLLPNKIQSYNLLGDAVNDGRLCGLIDWDHITDRTRNLRSLATWDQPSDIVSAAAHQFKIDMWEHQRQRLEVWIEKDALVGVIEGVCNELRVPYFSCRGYTSQSEMWAAGQRLLEHTRRDQHPIILHLGDHDPSGIDMSRDIEDRLTLFTGDSVTLKRLALNRDQIDQYQPPPNPAKTTDVRYEGYVALHGTESWELDALEPSVIVELVRSAVLAERDDEQWGRDQIRERGMRDGLLAVSKHWSEASRYVIEELAEIPDDGNDEDEDDTGDDDETED